ncbi:MAG: acyl-CoA carboxylase epsilon subunit [Brachybacterium sp.]|nr:acyl-CoA carboxylase epsilon subunit [Brachybacterium sp.]
MTAPVTIGSGGEVRLVSGRLSDVELAAIAVAVSAMSVISREEAAERALAEGTGVTDGWGSQSLALPGNHAGRHAPCESAWLFSQR